MGAFVGEPSSGALLIAPDYCWASGKRILIAPTICAAAVAVTAARDTITPVSDQYETPFGFTGTIERVMVDISDKVFEGLAAEAKAARARVAMGTQ